MYTPIIKNRVNGCHGNHEFFHSAIEFILELGCNKLAPVVIRLWTVLEEKRMSNVQYARTNIRPDKAKSIVQDIFSFWSFEIREDILRNQKIVIGLDSYSNQRSIYLAPF